MKGNFLISPGWQITYAPSFSSQSALRILPVFAKLKLNAYRQSYSKNCGMPPPSLCLNGFGGSCSGGQTCTKTLESSPFLHVIFLELFHMTYGSEMRDTKTAVKESVNTSTWCTWYMAHGLGTVIRNDRKLAKNFI
jgi:hypothetical protein